MRYPPLVAGSLLWLSTLTVLSVSQSTWTLDPQKHLALMFNHMSVKVNSTIYTIGGVAIYWTPESTASSTVSVNNNSVYILKTANSFLRALDLSKPVDLEAEFSDTSEVISELPFEIPHVKRGAAWADQNTIYYWGGELEWESVYMDGAFQNRTRELPDPMKYYTYDLNQPKGSGTWKTISISEAGGSDTLTSSPAYGEYAYSTEAKKGFYLGGLMGRYNFMNKDGSNATTVTTNSSRDVNSMVVFDSAMGVWKNETVIAELSGSHHGVMVYVAGVGEKGILVRMGGKNNNGLVSFDTTYVYDIAARVWYRQPTTSKTNLFPETRLGGVCAGAVAAADKTSFTIYIYGGFDSDSYIKRTWALTMPYFQWLPVGSVGEPERGRWSTTCHTIGGQLVMVRGHGGRGDEGDRCDTNGGTYFYDMTNLSWSLKYQPSEYRVPRTIYDVIGGNGQGGATITGPESDKNFAGGLGKLFTAAVNRSNSPNPGSGSSSSAGSSSSSSTSSRSSSSTGAIVGGVIAGIALLAAIGAAIWALLRLRRRSTDTVGGGRTMDGCQENSLIGMGENLVAPNHEGNSSYGHEIGRAPVPQEVHELDSAEVYGETYK
ncbi:hypothetical protein HOY80DRAFT_1019655 [Tuber brumale]|nr:hypothetical protein HOY80DRAFT_1019655 [Tuber brumale]